MKPQSDSSSRPSARDFAERASVERAKRYSAVAAEVAVVYGTNARKLFQLLCHLAVSKEACDVITDSNQAYLKVKIGADFVHAIEFEANSETVLSKLTEIKLVFPETLKPVATVSFGEIANIGPSRNRPAPTKRKRKRARN